MCYVHFQGLNKKCIDGRFHNKFSTSVIPTKPDLLMGPIHVLHYILFFFKHDPSSCDIMRIWGAVIWRVWVDFFGTFAWAKDICAAKWVGDTNNT